MPELKYPRVLLKLSGEALAGQKGTGFDFKILGRLADAGAAGGWRAASEAIMSTDTLPKPAKATA